MRDFVDSYATAWEKHYDQLGEVGFKKFCRLPSIVVYELFSCLYARRHVCGYRYSVCDRIALVNIQYRPI